MKTIEEKLKTRKYMNKLRISRLANGKCASCNNIRTEPHTYCEYHLQKRRVWEAKRRIIRISNNGCGSCATGTPLANTSVCLKCWWLIKSHTVNGVAHLDGLKDLWNKQDGRCAISGEVLIPGTNASIDHIIPKSKGGTNNPSNLQWVLTSINSGKIDMTQEEFINLCEVIVSHQKNKPLSQNQ